jgi:ABC-2 type transport system ATP-binding protein
VTRASGRAFAWTIVAIGAACLAPGVRPADATLHPHAEALTFGALAGTGLFFLLARRRLPASSLAVVPPRRLIARSLALAVKSAEEEAVWRGLVLGMASGPLGRPAALGLSTVLFAAAHLGRQGRAAATHLATGAVFGLVYLETGRLHAAVTAHTGYNVLVGAASLAGRGVSVSDTGRSRRTSLASDRTSARRPPMQPRPRSEAPSASPMALLDGVVKTFGTITALDVVDLELRRGEVVALLGANGAGKSTAVSILLGLRRPTAGAAWLRGRDPCDAAARSRVGAVLQDVGFPPALRVREVVELVRAHYVDPDDTRAVLDRLDLGDLADRDAAGLSGGQRRRLAVAVALAGRPEVLFLDEPTAGVDASARRTLLGDIAAFASTGGAVLLTTQQLAEAEEIASRVVVLATGRVVFDGTVPEARARVGLTRVTLRADVLPALPGVASVESRLDRHIVHVADADAFVARLVHSGVPFRELEVAPLSLEEAFVALTEERDG